MIVLLVLMLFHNYSNSLNITDLGRVCVYYFPFDTNDGITAPPDGFCTAVSSFSEYGPHHPLFRTDIVLLYLIYRHFPGGTRLPKKSRPRPRPRSRPHVHGKEGVLVEDGSMENIDELHTTEKQSSTIVNTFKRGLPFVYFFDADDIDGFVVNVMPDNVKQFADDLDKLITANSADAVVFDFFDLSKNELYVLVDDFQKNLKSFFDLMKQRHPDLLFGLKIHRNVDVNKSALDAKVIDASVDFYVVGSYDYTPCKYHNHQRDMAKPPSPEDMQKTISSLKDNGYNVQKLFLTIQVIVKSWKNKDKHAPAEWSYNWMCIAHPGKKRKFCRGTLDNFYRQGKVVLDNKLPGVFIQAIDCDDYLGNCGCGPFPAVRAINDGLTGSPENNTLSGCTTFGLLPKERKTPK